MSRARPVADKWFDTKKNGEKATHDQLELLAIYENVDLDDLLDTVTTQGEVIERLRYALGDLPIPTEVLDRRERWRKQRRAAPVCRKCQKKGDSTKHHFVNKWILRELASYAQRWADRSKNCIPMCIDCHRDLHSRDNSPQSVAHLLRDEEKDFTERALTALSEEKPKLLILIARGDESVYEARLVKDWLEGRFRRHEPNSEPVH